MRKNIFGLSILEALLSLALAYRFCLLGISIPLLEVVLAASGTLLPASHLSQTYHPALVSTLVYCELHSRRLMHNCILGSKK